MVIDGAEREGAVVTSCGKKISLVATAIRQTVVMNREMPWLTEVSFSPSGRRCVPKGSMWSTKRAGIFGIRSFFGLVDARRARYRQSPAATNPAQ